MGGKGERKRGGAAADGHPWTFTGMSDSGRAALPTGVPRHLCAREGVKGHSQSHSARPPGTVSPAVPQPRQPIRVGDHTACEDTAAPHLAGHTGRGCLSLASLLLMGTVPVSMTAQKPCTSPLAWSLSHPGLGPVPGALMGKGGLFSTAYSCITVMTRHQGFTPLPTERALGVPWVSDSACSHRDQDAGRPRAQGENCPQGRGPGPGLDTAGTGPGWVLGWAEPPQQMPVLSQGQRKEKSMWLIAWKALG